MARAPWRSCAAALRHPAGRHRPRARRDAPPHHSLLRGALGRGDHGRNHPADDAAIPAPAQVLQGHAAGDLIPSGCCSGWTGRSSGAWTACCRATTAPSSAGSGSRWRSCASTSSPTTCVPSTGTSPPGCRLPASAVHRGPRHHRVVPPGHEPVGGFRCRRAVRSGGVLPGCHRPRPPAHASRQPRRRPAVRRANGCGHPAGPRAAARPAPAALHAHPRPSPALARTDLAAFLRSALPVI